jgi:hypothetical protein
VTPRSLVESYYWDSDVFLTYINQGPDWANRSPVLDALLKAAEDGDVRIYASAISIIEVAFAQSEKDVKALDALIEGRIDGLWLDGTITMVELDFFAAREARRLIREAMARGWKCQFADAGHLGIATRLKVDEFHTYEPALVKYGPLIGCKVCEPHKNVQLTLGTGSPPQLPPD